MDGAEKPLKPQNTGPLLSALDSQDIETLLLELASRSALFARNRQKDNKTGEEAIIPVQQNVLVSEQLHETLDQLCGFYLAASSEMRARIRALALPHRSLHDLLIGHVYWTCKRIQSSSDLEWLLRGLAAASIEDNWIDWRDMFRALGELYLAATRVGIDASAYFKRVGELSSSEPGAVSGSPMRDFLIRFEESAYFKESIASEAECLTRPKAGREKILTRFWFRFESMPMPYALKLGCGVTAYSYDDALSLLREFVFQEVFPRIVEVREDIDISGLDQEHVIPNMGAVGNRGIWFPLGYTS